LRRRHSRRHSRRQRRYHDTVHATVKLEAASLNVSFTYRVAMPKTKKTLIAHRVFALSAEKHGQADMSQDTADVDESGC
jgi:hypothetical protein